MDWRWAQLLCKLEVLSSNSNPTKINKYIKKVEADKCPKLKCLLSWKAVE
jgi:hypothetical protein